MKRLKILLYADSLKDQIGQSSTYFKFFSGFGEVILVTAFNDLNFFIKHADVLALPGGLDVDPLRYGGIPSFDGNTRINSHYEYLDKKLLSPWIKTGKPIVAICRGMQSLNVEMGGTLYNDIYGHRWSSSDRSDNCESMTVLSEFVDPEIRDKGYLDIAEINSFHHQAVAKVADGFKVVGWGEVSNYCPSLKDEHPPVGRPFVEKDKSGKAKFDPTPYASIPEAMFHRTLPYVAFQYHPEEFDCPFATYNINRILKSYYGKTSWESTKETSKTSV